MTSVEGRPVTNLTIRRPGGAIHCGCAPDWTSGTTDKMGRGPLVPPLKAAELCGKIDAGP